MNLFILDNSKTISLVGPYGVRVYNNEDRDNAVVASFGLRMATPLKDFYITPFYDIGYSWCENVSKLYRASETNYMNAYDLQLLYGEISVLCIIYLYRFLFRCFNAKCGH